MAQNNQEIAEKLRHWREACALSQQQVADALNIDRTSYTKYETGKAQPSLNMLVQIAAIFNISPLLLLPMDAPAEKSVRRLQDFVQSNSPIFQLSKDERGLIAKYRALSKEQKRLVHELIAKMPKNDEDSSAK